MSPAMDLCQTCGLLREDPRHDMSKWPDSGHAFKRPLGPMVSDPPRCDKCGGDKPLPGWTSAMYSDPRACRCDNG